MKDKKQIRKTISRIYKKEKSKFLTPYDLGFRRALRWVLSDNENDNPYDKFDADN